MERNYVNGVTYYHKEIKNSRNSPLGYIREAPEQHSSPHLSRHYSAPLSALSSTGGHPAQVSLCGRICEFFRYLTHPKEAGIANNHLLLFKIASG